MGRVVRKIGLSSLALLVAFSLSCGKREGWQREPVVGDGETVELKFFSAPWCTNCTGILSELSPLLESDLAAYKNRINVTVVVVTDQRRRKAPNESDLQQYREKLASKGVTNVTLVAETWNKRRQYETYLKYFPWTGGTIPGAVVVGSEETVLSSLPPGSDFDAYDISESIRDAF